MTETSESLDPRLDFFGKTFNENQRLFFDIDEPAPEELEDTVASLEQTSDIANENIQPETPETPVNNRLTRREAFKLGSIIGGIVLGSAALLVVAVETTPAQTQKKTTPQELSVSLMGLPNELPAAVKAELGNVGMVEDEIYASQDIAQTSVDYESSSWVNGVEIDPSFVLSEGDLINQSDAKLKSTTECQQVTFSFSYFRDFLAQGYGTTTPNSTSKTPDLEALSLPQNYYYDPYSPTVPKITIAPKPPKPGEPLFFVNYENDTNGNPRTIYERNPAIYGGVYVNNYSDGYYNVLTGLKSYGKIPDSSSRDGSEDGAVFNAKGQLVGLSSGWSDKPSSVKQYEKWNNVKLTGLRPKTLITDTAIQPVSSSLVKQYEQSQQPIKQDCFPDGGGE